MTDPFNLTRFASAQEPVIDRVLAELTAGKKTSHWMWFVFPQFAGLGRSPMAKRYAIASLSEARAYLVHAVLGRRLVDCTELALAVAGRTAHEIFGSPDDMKFHSSMTLFDAVAPPRNVFAAALAKFFDGTRDAATLSLLGTAP